MKESKLLTIDENICHDGFLTTAIIDSAFNAISPLSFEYPNFHNWYYDKVVPGLFSRERKLLVYCVDDKISGVVILKDSGEEKKICTIRVHPAFRRQGIGKKMIEESFELLDTAHPVISVSSERIHQFRKILQYFGFKLEGKYSNFYMPEVTEYVFNGDLVSSEQFRLIDNIAQAKEGAHQHSLVFNRTQPIFTEMQSTAKRSLLSPVLI